MKKVFLLITFLFLAVNSSQAQDKKIDAAQCAQLGGEIINTLEKKGCEPPSGFLGEVAGMRCPCICCKKADAPQTAPDYSLTILDQNGHEVSAGTVIIMVKEGVTPERVEEIAKASGWHSRIIGLEINAYEIVIPVVKTAGELEAVMKKLRSYPEVATVEPNGIARIGDPPAQ